MLLQTNSYIVPKERRAEHARLIRRFRQALGRLGCDQFEVYEQVGANWSPADANGRYVQIMRFRDRQHQQSVQNAERSDPGSQAIIAEFCELINFPYQQQHGHFATGFYASVLPVGPRLVEYEDAPVEEEPQPAGEYAPAEGEQPLAWEVAELAPAAESAPAGVEEPEDAAEVLLEAEVAEPIEEEPFEEEEAAEELPAAALSSPSATASHVSAPERPVRIPPPPAAEEIEEFEEDELLEEEVAPEHAEAEHDQPLGAMESPLAVAEHGGSEASPESPALVSFLDSLTEEDLTPDSVVSEETRATGGVAAADDAAEPLAFAESTIPAPTSDAPETEEVVTADDFAPASSAEHAESEELDPTAEVLGEEATDGPATSELQPLGEADDDEPVLAQLEADAEPGPSPESELGEEELGLLFDAEESADGTATGHHHPETSIEPAKELRKF